MEIGLDERRDFHNMRLDGQLKSKWFLLKFSDELGDVSQLMVGLWSESFVGFGEQALVEELDGQGDDGLVREVEVEGHFGEVDEFFEDFFAELSFQNAREVAIDVDA
jgi:hypothetical protein